ncbi:TPA: hypothetical protein DEB00_03335 [Candidatus Uhrbacteria bacterium]|nr:hypothetical protein [Candidatus Uhrbacteria bacterium]
MPRQQTGEEETYEAFRERVFGPAYMVWHEGGPDTERIRAITDPQERQQTEKMLMRGVTQERDADAIRAWEVFDPQKGVQVILSVFDQGERGGYMAALAQFLLDHNRQATDQEKAMYREMIIGSITGDRGIYALDTLIAARHLPIDTDVVDALLERVAHAPGYLTRYHAADSLLELGHIEPKGIAQHAEIFSLIVPRLDIHQKELKPNQSDWERHQKAADLLRALLPL